MEMSSCLVDSFKIQQASRIRIYFTYTDMKGIPLPSDSRLKINSI